MHSFNHSKSYSSIFVADLPLRSHEAFDIQQKIKSSCIDKYSTFDSQWELTKAFSINNKVFNEDFQDKRNEFHNNSKLYAHQEIRYGFLATIKENMVHKVADEGLEVRLCPYNYFGHSICGIHISQNADVCMTEAGSKVGPDEEIILITFKYMLGRHKVVQMYDPNVLLAPTPNYDSHLCEERPDPNENIFSQYIKSLVYLYEFANDQLDPMIRPRQCCPVSALVYKQANPYNIVDLTDSEPVHARESLYNSSPLSFLKPVQQSHWGREFLLKAPVSAPRDPSIVIHKNDREDSRKVIMSVYNDDIPNKQFSMIPEENIERWEPIQHKFEDHIEDRNLRETSRSRSRRGFNERNDYIYPTRESSFDKLGHSEEYSRYGDKAIYGNGYSGKVFSTGNGFSSGSVGLKTQKVTPGTRNWFQ